LAPLVLRRHRVHRIPHPTFVTIAKRPSYRGGTARSCRDDLPDGHSEIFLQEGLDRDFAKLPVGQITCAKRSGTDEAFPSKNQANLAQK
jgi:hypothetical protein